MRGYHCCASAFYSVRFSVAGNSSRRILPSLAMSCWALSLSASTLATRARPR
jgi:hypothetical protein